jgi:hypothetical protein
MSQRLSSSRDDNRSVNSGKHDAFTNAPSSPAENLRCELHPVFLWTSVGPMRKPFAVTCSVICLLLVAMWLRSFWWEDAVVVHKSGERFVRVGAAPGAIQVATGGKSRVAPWNRIVESAPEVIHELSNMGIPYPSRFWGRFYIGSSILLVPYWFLILLVVSLAAPPTRNIIWRFSLRMALLFLTLAAGVIGLMSGLR